jgi:hypothetical protein
MNCDSGCVSAGGEDSCCEERGVAALWLDLYAVGDAVASLVGSVAVDSWLVNGEGRYWFLMGVWSWIWEDILCDLRGFLIS